MKNLAGFFIVLSFFLSSPVSAHHTGEPLHAVHASNILLVQTAGRFGGGYGFGGGFRRSYYGGYGGGFGGECTFLRKGAQLICIAGNTFNDTYTVVKGNQRLDRAQAGTGVVYSPAPPTQQPSVQPAAPGVGISLRIRNASKFVARIFIDGQRRAEIGPGQIFEGPEGRYRANIRIPQRGGSVVWIAAEMIPDPYGWSIKAPTSIN